MEDSDKISPQHWEPFDCKLALFFIKKSKHKYNKDIAKTIFNTLINESIEYVIKDTKEFISTINTQETMNLRDETIFQLINDDFWLFLIKKRANLQSNGSQCCGDILSESST